MMPAIGRGSFLENRACGPYPVRLVCLFPLAGGYGYPDLDTGWQEDYPGFQGRSHVISNLFVLSGKAR